MPRPLATQVGQPTRRGASRGVDARVQRRGVHTSICIPLYAYLYMHTSICIPLGMRTRTRTRTHTHTHAGRCISSLPTPTHTCTHAHMQAHTHRCASPTAHHGRCCTTGAAPASYSKQGLCHTPQPHPIPRSRRHRSGRSSSSAGARRAACQLSCSRYLLLTTYY